MSVTKVVLAKLSPTMEEGTIVKWSKNEGDPVKVGDVLAEIETDKANMEMEALGTGVLRKILVPAGGKAPVGALIGVIAEPNEDISAMLASAAPAAAAPAPASAPTAPAPPPRPPARPARSRPRSDQRRSGWTCSTCTGRTGPSRTSPLQLLQRHRSARRRADRARSPRLARQPPTAAASRPARSPGPWRRERTSRCTPSRAQARPAASSSGTSRPIGPPPRPLPPLRPTSYLPPSRPLRRLRLRQPWERPWSLSPARPAR